MRAPMSSHYLYPDTRDIDLAVYLLSALSGRQLVSIPARIEMTRRHMDAAGYRWRTEHVTLIRRESE